MSEVVPDTALDALRQFGIDGLDDYGRALRAACAASPPPFGFSWYGERYRYHASDPSWFANSLICQRRQRGRGFIEPLETFFKDQGRRSRRFGAQTRY